MPFVFVTVGIEAWEFVCSILVGMPIDNESKILNFELIKYDFNNFFSLKC